jgi:glutathionylspermidine synthase
MKRVSETPRRDWKQIISDQGLIYNDSPLPDGTIANYWNESAAYTFTMPEVERLEQATAELFEMCIAAGDYLLTGDNYRRLGIPEAALPAIRATWNDDSTPSVYGRFDLAYNGTDLKLLEFNADTPTSLLESAAVQWFWLKDVHPDQDQFNSIHERLVAACKRRHDSKHLKSDTIYFASSRQEDSGEDYFTTTYMAETARQAGLTPRSIAIEDIGYTDAGFVDLDDRPIESIFKLYPWEWMAEERFGEHAFAATLSGQTQWIEPAYKMLWSNKGILAALWELYPNHPLLLETYIGDPKHLKSYASKPLLGREGQGIELVRAGTSIASAPGSIAPGPRVYQGLQELPDFNGNRPVIGSWVIDGEPAGIGIRESDGPITDNLSRYVPHYIV